MSSGKHITLVMTSNAYHDRRMMRIRKSLIQAGYRVSVLARYIEQLAAEPSEKEIKLLKTKSRSGPAMYYQFNQAVYNALIASPPDLIYAVDLDTLWGVYRAHNKLNIPFVFDAHEFYTETPEINKRVFKKWLWTRLAKLAIPRSSARWTVTETIANRLSDKYGVPFLLVRNVPELGALAVSPRPELISQVRLIYLGVINEGRGLLECIRAMQSRPNIYLDILGHGDIEPQVKSLIKDLELNDRCTLHGWVEESDHGRFLAQAHYGINILDASSESYRLSLANKFFDYVHAGLPAIHMNYPEYAHLNQEYPVAVLLDNTQPQSIGQLLDRVSSDKEIYGYLASNCLQARLQWNWQNEKEVLLTSVKNVLGA